MLKYRLLLVHSILAAILGIGVLVCGCSKKVQKIKKEKIRYANWEVYPAQLRLHQEVVDRFKSYNPDIEVEFEIVQGGPKKILIQMAGGVAPDVFYWCDSMLPPLVEKKSVVDMMPLIKNDPEFNLDIYIPRTIEGLRYDDGGLYGLPIYFGSNALVYNKDMFDRASLEYPASEWTWDDFAMAAQKLTIRDENDRAIQYGALSPIVPDITLIIKSYGGDIFNKDFTKCIFNSPQTRDALQFLLDLMYKYRVVPLMSELEGEDKGRSGLQMFMVGKIGMYIAPSFALPTLNEIKRFKWDVAPIPVRKGYPRLVPGAAGNISISSQCKNLRAAWKFAKFIASPEGTGIFGKGRNCVPPIKDVAYTTFAVPPPDNVKVYIESIEDTAPMLKVTWADECMSSVRLEMDLLLMRKQSIDETIDKIARIVNKYLE